jgi:hypothetical protein
MSGINWFNFIKNMDTDLKVFKPVPEVKNIEKVPEVESNIQPEPKTVRVFSPIPYSSLSKPKPELECKKDALLKLEKVSNTLNNFIRDFIVNSGIENNKEYLEAWNSQETQTKLNAYIKQKKIKMKETVEERNKKKLEKKIKMQNRNKDKNTARVNKSKENKEKYKKKDKEPSKVENKQ